MKYDVLIIGSGMGGLICGDVLSRQGLRVCILEKNKQLGGSLQIFSRRKVLFDSGVHYLGGLAPGQNLYQIFKYLGLMEKLRLEKMDPGFDRILVGDDPKEYVLSQGYDAFIARLSADFPGEEKAITLYCDQLRAICAKFPMYQLQMDADGTGKEEVLPISAKNFIESLTANKTLRAVLAGTNMLYAGSGEETPLYVHALILNSYIESAWRCVDGGSQIARLLAANIRDRGGEIFSNHEVKKILTDEAAVTGVELTDGRRLEADKYISNIHPAATLRMTDSAIIRPMTRTRFENLRPTVSSFIVNIVFKKDCYPYIKHNYYYHAEGQLWDMDRYTEADWPRGYALYMSPTADTREFADGMTIFAYMRYEEMRPWAESFNTVSHKNDRGEDYARFKERKAEQLLQTVYARFPAIKDCIDTYYTSTPLSYRDYIGTDDGNLYGAAKNFRDPYSTRIETRTKLPNLFLTGQHLNLHGILGAAISGLVTCAAVTGSSGFIEKINHA